MRYVAFLDVDATLLRQVAPFTQQPAKDATMPRANQSAKRGRTTKVAAVTALAGLGFALAGSASATTMPAAVIPRSDDISPNQRFVLGEEEWPTSVSPPSISSIRKAWVATCS
jgi:hypothetical protein